MTCPQFSELDAPLGVGDDGQELLLLFSFVVEAAEVGPDPGHCLEAERKVRYVRCAVKSKVSVKTFLNTTFQHSCNKTLI